MDINKPDLRLLEPTDPNYNAPLFLDCCGLVRQAVNNLHEEFGFKLKKENQSYQFDLLPIKLKKDQLLPGDLIFYKGIYYEKKKKRLHDIVHVEVFLGETQTIGARDTKGVISIHPHYQFESKNYHSIVIYFKSIETWLDGVCKSFCSIHTWDDNRINNSLKKYSNIKLNTKQNGNIKEETQISKQDKKQEQNKIKDQYQAGSNLYNSHVYSIL